MSQEVRLEPRKPTKENVSRRRDQVWYHIMEFQKRIEHKSLIVEWVQTEVERILSQLINKNLPKNFAIQVVEKQILDGWRNGIKQLFFFFFLKEVQHIYMLMGIFQQRGKNVNMRDNFQNNVLGQATEIGSNSW